MGLKAWQKAEELNIPIGEYLESNAKEFKEFCSLFEIGYDSLYRTSSKDHHEKVKKLWNIWLANDDIYKKSYTALYCSGCEIFRTEKDLINGKCPDHQTVEIKTIAEENWFFRLSKYQSHLLSWIENNPQFLSPSNKLEELKNVIKNIEDISFSRLKTSVPHGIDVPNDPEQVIYCWGDALSNYIISCGYLEDEDKFNGWWENTVQICGSDNLRFQAVIFQAMLASLNIKQTGKLLVHGTVLCKDGRKMSKTDGNVIDIIKQLNKFGLNAVRYYVLAGLTTYGDNAWSEDNLVKLFNAHIAEGVGNLLNRVLHLISIKGVHAYKFNHDNGVASTVFSSKFWEDSLLLNDAALYLWETYEINEALLKTNELGKHANKYIQEQAPWDVKCENPSEVLNNLYNVLELLYELYLPVFSKEKSAEFRAALDTKTKIILFPKIEKEPVVA